MRGDNIKPFSAATIVDIEGVPVYHVVPSRLIAFGLFSMILLILIAVILGFLVLENRADIEDLKQKITVEESR